MHRLLLLLITLALLGPTVAEPVPHNSNISAISALTPLPFVVPDAPAPEPRALVPLQTPAIKALDVVWPDGRGGDCQVFVGKVSAVALGTLVWCYADGQAAPVATAALVETGSPRGTVDSALVVRDGHVAIAFVTTAPNSTDVKQLYSGVATTGIVVLEPRVVLQYVPAVIR